MVILLGRDHLLENEAPQGHVKSFSPVSVRVSEDLGTPLSTREIGFHTQTNMSLQMLCTSKETVAEGTL